MKADYYTDWMKQYRRLCEDARLLLSFQADELEATGEVEAMAEDVAGFLCDHYGYSHPSFESGQDKAFNAIYDYILNNWSE
jgi:hypothetical protein